jgi:amino acid transporter
LNLWIAKTPGAPARYLYSLGREKVLPSALGRTHVKYRSPHIASIAQSVIAALIVLAFYFFTTTASGSDAATSQAYVQLYGLAAFMGVVLILFIQALASVAIWNYFRTHHPSEHRLWNHTIAPLISVVAQFLRHPGPEFQPPKLAASTVPALNARRGERQETVRVAARRLRDRYPHDERQ